MNQHKMSSSCLHFFFLFVNIATINSNEFNNQIDYTYEPKWESLDSRPLPSWYDEAKFGILIHWGVFSVPAFSSEWLWYHWKEKNPRQEIKEYMKKNFPPEFSYQEFAKDFSAEFFNPNDWIAVFNASGAKYVILTTKHHEGYTLWPSKYSFSWNSMDIGPHRDIVGEFVNAVRENSSLTLGLYHSLYEWFNPLWIDDKRNNFTTQNFAKMKTVPESYELIEKYRPAIFWSDGELEATDDYWQAKEFLAWLYNASPVKDTVVVNDRWGYGSICHHGGFYTCADHYNPGVLQAHKFENAMSIDKKSWGYRRNVRLEEIHSTKELITEFVSTVSCGGNYLLSVGATKEGIIIPIFEERLREVGQWLKINGEAIYATKPWEKCQNDSLTSNIWYTSKSKNGKLILFAISLFWPKEGKISLKCLAGIQIESIYLLGDKSNKPLKENIQNSTVQIYLPPKTQVDNLNLGWTFKITTGISKISKK